MKIKYVSLLLAVLISQSVFSANDIPTNCPSLTAIKSVDVTSVKRDSTWGWMGFTNNKYDTNVMWSLGIFIINNHPQDVDEATKEANAELALMVNVNGPDKLNDQWVCVYQGNHKELAVASTPPFVEKLLSMVAKYKH